jgi:hypothetical protein
VRDIGVSFSAYIRVISLSVINSIVSDDIVIYLFVQKGVIDFATFNIIKSVMLWSPRRL